MSISRDASAYDCLLKVLLVGDTNVGKSSILTRFTDDIFDKQGPSTIGVDFKNKIVYAKGQKVKVALWDTAGQERYRSLTSTFYRGSHGIVVVYDCTDRSSFDRLEYWLKEIEYECGNPKAVKILLGNKIDLPCTVSAEDGGRFARDHGMLFMQTSAKNRTGIEKAFDELISRMLEVPSNNALVSNAKKLKNLEEPKQTSWFPKLC